MKRKKKEIWVLESLHIFVCSTLLIIVLNWWKYAGLEISGLQSDYLGTDGAESYVMNSELP